MMSRITMVLMFIHRNNQGENGQFEYKQMAEKGDSNCIGKKCDAVDR